MLFRDKNTNKFISLEELSRQAWLYSAEIRSRAFKANKALYDYIYLNPLECAQLMGYDYYNYYEEVYVKLCDNIIDKSYERFSNSCLKDMKDMFIGKKIKICGDEYGLIDSVEIVHEKPLKYIYLKARVILPVNNKTKSIVNQIKEGTVKKVSVAVSIKNRYCSICGNKSEECSHIPGKNYKGKLCYINLYDPIDVFESAFMLEKNNKGENENMTCYRNNDGCSPYEERSCDERPANKPESLNNPHQNPIPHRPIKDWTLQECKDWCEKQTNGCPEHCPLEDLCTTYFEDEPQAWRLNDHFVFTEDEIEKAEAIKTLFPNAESIVKADTGTITVIGTNLAFSSDYFPTIPNGVTCNIDEIING